MWIFGYGSLMWDGWELKHGCARKCLASIKGYRRTFDKASIKNRGTKKDPCPTLNLEADASGTCTGMAFEFSDEQSARVLAYLQNREGKDFRLEIVTVRLADGVDVQAFVPIYRGKNLISGVTLAQKAATVRQARGREGSGEDYVREIAELLPSINIHDEAVEELWAEVQRQGTPDDNAEKA